MSIAVGLCSLSLFNKIEVLTHERTLSLEHDTNLNSVLKVHELIGYVSIGKENFRD